MKRCKKNYVCPKKLENVNKKTENWIKKLKLRVIMPDKARLPWKQGRVP